MRGPIAFSLLILLVAPLGGGQFKAGEYPQGVGKATSGVEAVSSLADQPEPSTSGEIFPRTKEIFGWLIKSGAENRPVPATRAVPIAASTSVASETTVDAGSSPVGDWLSGTSRPGMPRPGMPGSVTTSTRSPRVDSPVRRAQAAPGESQLPLGAGVTPPMPAASVPGDVIPSVGGQSISLQAALYGTLTSNPDLATLRLGNPTTPSGRPWKLPAISPPRSTPRCGATFGPLP